jgi:hypothetical protein
MTMAGFQLTDGQMKTLRETVRIVKLMPGGGSMNPQHHGVQAPRAVVLDAALAVATHAFTGATSALATRLDWSIVNEEYTESDQQITVWNHSETDEYETDTFGMAMWIDGHWWFLGDCGPMASR